MKPLIAILCCALLCGCTTYEPLGRNGGYTDSQMSDDTWVVTFAALGKYPDAMVEDLAILRAAEVTSAAGFHWFSVAERSQIVRNEQSGPTLRIVVRGSKERPNGPAYESARIIPQMRSRYSIK